jgi:predicted Kef-type K+ transport protein
MPNLTAQNSAAMNRFPVWSIVAYVVVISIAVDAALLISVMAHLNWIYSTVWALSAAVISGVVLFTALQTRRQMEDR